MGSILVPSFSFGLGLALDLFLLTVASFKNDRMSFFNWTLPLIFTHITFPTFSIWLLWFFGEGNDSSIKIILGLVGFSFIFWFLYEEFKGILSGEHSENCTHYTPHNFQIFAILAVSWDALFCGPAFAVSTKDWHLTEIILSVSIFGLVVFIFSTTALFIAKRLRKIKFKDEAKLEKFEFVGDWLKFSVIGAFGFLSLWHVFGDGNFYHSLIFSTLFFGVIFYSIKNSVLKLN